MKITRRQLRRLITEEMRRLVEQDVGDDSSELTPEDADQLTDLVDLAVDDARTDEPAGAKISDLISHLQKVQGEHGDLVINHPGLDTINRPPKPATGKDHDAYTAWTHPHSDPSNWERSNVEDWFNDLRWDNTKLTFKKWKWLNYGLGGMSGGRL